EPGKQPRPGSYRLPCRKDPAGRGRESPDRCQAPEAHSRGGRPEDAGAAFPQDHEISPAGEGRSQQAASASPTCPIRRQGGKREMTSLRKDNPTKGTSHV